MRARCLQGVARAHARTHKHTLHTHTAVVSLSLSGMRYLLSCICSGLGFRVQGLDLLSVIWHVSRNNLPQHIPSPTTSHNTLPLPQRDVWSYKMRVSTMFANVYPEKVCVCVCVHYKCVPFSLALSLSLSLSLSHTHTRSIALTHNIRAYISI